MPPARVEHDRDAPARGRELDGVRQQVPDDLLQAIGIADRRQAADRGRLVSSVSVARLGGGPHRFDGGVDDRREIDRRAGRAAACRW